MSWPVRFFCAGVCLAGSVSLAFVEPHSFRVSLVGLFLAVVAGVLVRRRA